MSPSYIGLRRCRGLGIVERRSSASSAVTAQRELRDDQHRAPNLSDREVHLSGRILEDTEVADLACHIGEVFGAVALFDAGKDKQSTANLADHAPVDTDACGGTR